MREGQLGVAGAFVQVEEESVVEEVSVEDWEQRFSPVIRCRE
jgi:hypothetical protein